MRKVTLPILIAVALALSACGSSTTPQPVGVGRGIDKLKGTPCSGGCTSFPNPSYDGKSPHEVV